MTITRPGGGVPGSDGDVPAENGGRQDQPVQPQLTRSAFPDPSRRADDERHELVKLADRILTSRAALVRALIVLVVVLVLLFAAVGLLGVQLDVGPVHLGPGTSSR
jgi:hypothetical protein